MTIWESNCRNCRTPIYDFTHYRFCSESCQREFEADEAEHRYQMACDDKLEKKWEAEHDR